MDHLDRSSRDGFAEIPVVEFHDYRAATGGGLVPNPNIVPNNGELLFGRDTILFKPPVQPPGNMPDRHTHGFDFLNMIPGFLYQIIRQELHIVGTTPGIDAFGNIGGLL